MCIRDRHYPVVPYFKLQYIVFVVQHGQMDIFLNTFLIGIIRQLLISPIPRDDGDVYKRQL